MTLNSDEAKRRVWYACAPTSSVNTYKIYKRNLLPTRKLLFTFTRVNLRSVSRACTVVKKALLPVP